MNRVVENDISFKYRVCENKSMVYLLNINNMESVLLYKAMSFFTTL